MKIEEK